MNARDIVLFGDSYTDGWIKGSTGFFADALGVPIVRRFARSGTTAGQWVDDIDGLLTGVLGSNAPIAVGSLLGNDLFAALRDGTVTSDEAMNGIMDLGYVLAKIAGGKQRTVVMVYPDPFFGKNPQSALIQPKLAAAVKSVCAAVSDLYGGVIALDLSGVLKPEHFDGQDVHPNAEGYRAMAEAVLALEP